MTNGPELNPRFVTDAQGQRTAVILPIEEYDQLLEDIADLTVVAQRGDEPSIPHEKLVEELKEDGHLSD